MLTHLLTDYFGCTTDNGLCKNEDEIILTYKGEKLLFEILIDFKKKEFCVSGDFEQPFSYSSLFEFCVPFDSIDVEQEEAFYGDQKILVCRKTFGSLEDIKTLMIIKWPNGELSVWPSNIFNNLNELPSA